MRHVNRATFQGKRDFALLNLLVRTGLRTIEVVRANVGDLEPRGREVLLWVQGKGRDGKDEFVLLTKETHSPLLEYLSARGSLKETEPLFVSTSHRNANQRLTTRSVSRLVKSYLYQQGLASRRLTAHSLRHTAITLALVGGATLQEAQALGRHASVETALLYAHNLDRFNRAPERKVDAVLRECLQ